MTETDKLREALLSTAASLAAAISLLERGGKAAKKAAPSDKMFDQMLADYRATLGAARAALAAAHAPNQPASQPDADEREAMVRLLQIITRNGSLDDGRTLHEVIADALLAAGLRLPSDNGDMK